MSVTPSCPTLCNPIGCSSPGSSVHGILQARVAIPFSRESSLPRDQTWFSCTAGRFFTIWATREVYCVVTKSCSIVWDPWIAANQAPLFMGFSQARILEWVVIGELSDPGIQTAYPTLAEGFFTVEPQDYY